MKNIVSVLGTGGNLYFRNSRVRSQSTKAGVLLFDLSPGKAYQCNETAEVLGGPWMIIPHSATWWCTSITSFRKCWKKP